jgi:hypothetical protein
MPVDVHFCSGSGFIRHTCQGNYISVIFRSCNPLGEKCWRKGRCMKILFVEDEMQTGDYPKQSSV